MRRKQPEARFAVSVIGDDVCCRWPNGESQTVSLPQLLDVHVETNDSGPWGMDVWFVLREKESERECAFPLGATGEDVVIERLKQLPGFQIAGMNSTANARFLCWRRDAIEDQARD